MSSSPQTRESTRLLQISELQSTDWSDRSVRPVRPVCLEQKAKTLNFLSSSPSSRFSPCSSPSLFFLSFNLVLLPLCHPSPEKGLGEETRLPITVHFLNFHLKRNDHPSG